MWHRGTERRRVCLLRPQGNGFAATKVWQLLTGVRRSGDQELERSGDQKILRWVDQMIRRSEDQKIRRVSGIRPELLSENLDGGSLRLRVEEVVAGGAE